MSQSSDIANDAEKPWQKPDHIESKGQGNQQISERIYRMMTILMELSKGEFVLMDDLVDSVGVHRRTIQRDFKVIRDIGFKIHYTRGKGYIIGDDFISPPIRFKLYETLAVMLMAQASEANLSQPLVGSSREAFEKLTRTLSPESRDDFRQIRKRISVHNLGEAVLNIDIEIFRVLLDAMLENRKCLCVYNSIYDKQVIEYVLDPYHLHFCNRRWYIIGYSSMHQDIRTFSLNRFDDIHMMSSTFELSKDFNLYHYFDGAWQMIPGDEYHVIELEFSAKVGRNVHEVKWHPSQQSYLRPDGTCIVKFKVKGIHEIKWWVMGYGDQVHVRKPDILRETILDAFRNALKQAEEKQSVD